MGLKHEKDAVKHRNLVKNFIEKYDQEFKPSLSSRYGSIDEAAEKFVQDKEIILKEDEEFKGFLTFTRGEEREELEDIDECIYINLIIVKKNARNQGIAKELYHKLTHEILENSNYETAAVRTWKENIASRISIKNSGFKKINEVKTEKRENFYYIYN